MSKEELTRIPEKTIYREIEVERPLGTGRPWRSWHKVQQRLSDGWRDIGPYSAASTAWIDLLHHTTKNGPCRYMKLPGGTQAIITYYKETE